MVHGTHRSAWLLLSILVVPATGVFALRHAVGPQARAEGPRANARVWVTDFSVPDRGKRAAPLTVEELSLIPESGPEVPLVSPTGAPIQVSLHEIDGGRIALAGAGAVPAGRYAALRVGIGGRDQDLPLVLALEAGRELDLVVGVKAQPSGTRARIASLEQR
jgi:hypothetical protein